MSRADAAFAATIDWTLDLILVDRARLISVATTGALDEEGALVRSTSTVSAWIDARLGPRVTGQTEETVSAPAAVTDERLLNLRTTDQNGDPVEPRESDVVEVESGGVTARWTVGQVDRTRTISEANLLWSLTVRRIEEF